MLDPSLTEREELCRIVLATALIGLGAAGWCSAQGAVPVGGQFEVNAYTTGAQTQPVVGIDAEGDFVVVWVSDGSPGTDSSLDSVQGQLIASDGSPTGGQLQINTSTSGYQFQPAVAVDPQGDFVVVWTSSVSAGSDSSSYSIQGQRFSSGAAPLGGEFQVNTCTTGFQELPAVAADPAGGFLAVWTSACSQGSDSDGRSIQAQRYDASGTAVGGELQVNSYTTSEQALPAVAFAADGSFVAAWFNTGGSSGTDIGSRSIQARRFDSGGNPLGGDFQVNTYSTNHQYNPSVAMRPGGDFVVVWTSNGSSGSDSGYSIQGQRFASDGTPQAGEFQVNTYTTYIQSRARAAADANGGFVVTWTSGDYFTYGPDGDRTAVAARSFASDGSGLGDELVVNTFTTDRQRDSTITAGPGGRFMVVWGSSGSAGADTSDDSIQGRRLETTLFADGFESGDIGAWSSARAPMPSIASSSFQT